MGREPTYAILTALAALVLLAGCLGLGEDGTGIEELEEDDGSENVSTEGQAVIALIDTGINPYHEAFRDDDPLREQHPSTYIDDYPEDAERLNLTMDADSWPDAVEADCEDVWSQIEEGKIYWVPGTKIVGAVAVGSGDALDCGQDPMEASSSRILDLNGHGTMVASRAAGNDYGACEECHVMAVHGFNEDSVEWTADHHDWIDMQSNSWGPFVPVWTPEQVPAPIGSDPSFVETVEEAAQDHLSFWASGNGALTRGGVLGHPTTQDPRLTPSVIMVGGHDSGYVNTWPGFPPDVVSNSCNGWAAHHDSLDESSGTAAGGTSGATPYAAGKTAKMLKHARTQLGDAGTGIEDGIAATGQAAEDLEGPIGDGELTKHELERLMKATADTRPTQEDEDGPRCDAQSAGPYASLPVQWEDVPDEYPEYVHIGYGAVNKPSTELAIQVLDGEKTLPDRSDADRFFEFDDQARETIHDVYTTNPADVDVT